jgi:hypothetical protein
MTRYLKTWFAKMALPLNRETLISLAANALYLQQVTGDSGSGAILGDFEGTDMGSARRLL